MVFPFMNIHRIPTVNMVGILFLKALKMVSFSFGRGIVGENKTLKKRNQLNINLIAFCFSEPGGTRTPNLLVRSQMLYPIKLQVLLLNEEANITKFKNNKYRIAN
jgi:hypothetical protein